MILDTCYSIRASADEKSALQSFGKAHLELTGSMPAGWRNQRTANNDIPHGWKLFVGQLPSEVSSMLVCSETDD